MVYRSKLVPALKLSLLVFGFLAANIGAKKACIDTHDLKTQCLEWAYFGEWYVIVLIVIAIFSF